MQRERRLRVERGEVSACRVELAVIDACCADAWAPHIAAGRRYDALVDKSTTDGLLCDTRLGAERVRAIYSNVGSLLAGAALVVVVSWRDPSLGLEWVVDLVLGGLRQAERRCEHGDCAYSWTLDVHSIQGHGSRGTGPHVYMLRRRPRRVMRRRATGRRLGHADNDLTVRQYVHSQ